MPVPHLEIRIVQRSKGSSAVAGAAYQAGEKLFSEYDQKAKDHRRKQHEVVYTEIMLPSHAPPEYADRATLWNSAEKVEKQWNSQLARRFVVALPRDDYACNRSWAASPQRGSWQSQRRGSVASSG